MSSTEASFSSTGRPVRRCRLQNESESATCSNENRHIVNSSRKRRQRESLSPGELEHHDKSLAQRKKVNEQPGNVEFSADLFSSYMMDDTFLLVLRFFVSDSGLVEGDSIASIMCVSKRWYAAANSRPLWTVQPPMQRESAHYIPRRPSPWIRELRPGIRSLYLANLIGFANLGRREQEMDDERRSFTVRERASGELYILEILDAGDNRVIRSAASAHHLTGRAFLERNDEDDSHLYLPVGMDRSNGRVACWFEYADRLPNWFRNFPNSISPLTNRVSTKLPFPIAVLKNWFRQLLRAVQNIHCTGAVHGCILPDCVHLDSSKEPSEALLKIACPSLFPVVSDLASYTHWKYTCPERQISRSNGHNHVPTVAGDVWSIGCILAEIVRCGVPLFIVGSDSYREGGRLNTLAWYARKVCHLVGRPPLGGALPSLRRENYPLDATENLRRELKALDEEGLDFMKKLLSADPAKRPTAAEALAHPFLSEERPTRSLAPVIVVPLVRKLDLISMYRSWESQEYPLSPTRKHVRMDAWAVLTDYVIEIVDVFDLNEPAAFRAMNYFDRFISRSPLPTTISSRKCQILAGTCLHMASKCDHRTLRKGDLVFCADNTFSRTDVWSAEEVILRKLNWKLSYPTIYDFVKLFLDVLDHGENSKPKLMARYIAELALQSQVYLAYRPSLIASCVVALALFCVEETDLWPTILAEAAGYARSDLEQCMMALLSDIHHVRSTMPELKIISRRYRKYQRGRVALQYTIPRITSFAAFERQVRPNGGHNV